MEDQPLRDEFLERKDKKKEPVVYHTENYHIELEDREPSFQGAWIIEKKSGIRVALIPYWFRFPMAIARQIAEKMEENRPKLEI